ncbi:MAG: polysaccharide biosynthesis/export family protein [Thermaurantimonas sp.]|uniref:polysaccharide biosynthesis/export family protein n=1 Tax=Thermaurantimonas sp. TaxID=2681568 RepID=UPI00391B20F7
MKRFLFSFIVLILFSSCVTRKQLTYFRDSGASIEVDSAEFQRRLMIKYRLQVGDMIKVEVLSTNKEVNELFNLAANQLQFGMMGGVGAGLDPLFYLNGFSIDMDGEVKLPIIGNVKVAGKNLLEVQEIIEKELHKFFEPGSVKAKVRIPGINIKVIGDVRRPGRYVFMRNYVTIIDALAEAGDIDFVGDRKEVEIIRMTANGYVFKKLDLTDRKVLSSPDIFLEPNDIINVKPLPAKSWGIGTTGFQTFTGILSVISTLLTLIIVSRTLSN